MKIEITALKPVIPELDVCLHLNRKEATALYTMVCIFGGPETGPRQVADKICTELGKFIEISQLYQIDKSRLNPYFINDQL